MTAASSLAGSCGYSDETLVQALAARDPAAALVAWQRFLPLVMQTLRRRIGSSDMADDVAQEVFAYLFDGVHKLRNPRALRAFVVTLADRLLTNELRRRRRRARVESEVENLQRGEIGEQADAFSRHAFGRLCRLLGRLRERDRRVLLMCSVDRLKLEEAATLLGVSIPTVRRSLGHARRRVVSWSEADPFLCEFATIQRLRRRAPTRASDSS